MMQVIQGASIDLTANFYDGPGGMLTDPTAVQLSIYRNGTLGYGPFAYPAAISKVATGVYRYHHDVDSADAVGPWEARWTVTINGVPTVATELFEVVSGAYATRNEVRALDILRDEGATYTDEMLDEGIEWAIERVEQETGTSWVHSERTITVDGNGRSSIFVGVGFVRAVVACTVDGVAQDVTGWVGTEDGMIRRTDGGSFPCSVGGQNVTITFTAGVTSVPPADVKWAVRTLARWYVLRLLAAAPDNVVQTTGEYGTVLYAQPGKYGPTSLPEVNAVLARRCHRIPGVA